MDADEVGDHRGVAGGDVAERPGVHQYRGVLQGLQQVRLDRIPQQHGHRPRAVQLLGGHRSAVGGVADHDPPQPLPQVSQ